MGVLDTISAELQPLARRLGHQGAVWFDDIFRVVRALDRAESLGPVADQAVAHLELADLDRNAFAYHGYRLVAGIRFRQGLWDDADALLRPSIERETRGAFDGIGLGLLSQYGAYRGDPAPFARLREQSGLLPEPGRPNTVGRWYVLAVTIRSAIVLGETGIAWELYDLILEAIANDQLQSSIGGLWHLQAATAAAAGEQWDVAERHFKTALGQAHDFPNRSEQPEVRYWWARMLIDRGAHGDKERARTLLEEAIEIYGQLGMPKHLDMAKEQLAKL